MHHVQITVCGLLAAFALPALAQQPVTIREDVNLVQLEAVVTDGQGQVVSGLGKDAFHLFVDNAPQPITVFQRDDAPVTVGIVIDNSASMAPKQKEVIAAALAFARAGNSKDQIFVVHFNSQPRFGLPSGTPFTGDVSELESAVSAFHLGGTTAFYDALLMAESQFKSAYYPRKVLLTITDGGDNSSSATLNDALKGAAKAGVVIYSIGIFDQNDKDRNPRVLSEIADKTRGKAFFPEQIPDVTRICVSIAEEIRKQYTLGFPGTDDGQFHRIRLAAKDPQYGPLEVHTQNGYLAGKSPDSGTDK